MAEPTVFIVDDHAGVRDSIAELVDSVGLAHASFASAQQFLDAFDPAASGCLVLDVRMAHMSGPALQERLNAMGARIPIVFISAHADIDVAVRTIRAGAVNFVTKPYRDQQLLDSINEALARDATVRAAPGAGDAFAAKLATLSERERQVTDLVVAGQSSKAIARTLGISPRTVELHRGHVFDKLGVKSVAELVRLVVEHRAPRA
jgi:FixJ family two-component response regulator